MKVLHVRQDGDERPRFVREVEALHALRHDAIVRVLGWGEDAAGGRVYLAMELGEGEDLSRALHRGPLDPASVHRLALALADGLAHAHGRGVAHRDIKPANVLLRADGAPLLVDFGIATQAGRTAVTEVGTAVGTPAYMPPEVFLGDGIPDAAAGDVYGLGVVLYEALTGRAAFPEADGMSASQRIVRLIRQKQQTGPLDPGVAAPAALRRAVCAATDPDPARRPSMRELRDTIARAPGAPPRRRAWAVGGAVVVGVGAVLAGVAVVSAAAVAFLFAGRAAEGAPSDAAPPDAAAAAGAEVPDTDVVVVPPEIPVEPAPAPPPARRAVTEAPPEAAAAAAAAPEPGAPATSAIETPAALVVAPSAAGTVCFYRTANAFGAAVPVTIWEGDNRLATLRNASFACLGDVAAGRHEFAAKTEVRASATVEVHPGETSYVAVNLVEGTLVGRPQVRAVSGGEFTAKRSELREAR